MRSTSSLFVLLALLALTSAYDPSRRALSLPGLDPTDSAASASGVASNTATSASQTATSDTSTSSTSATSTSDTSTSATSISTTLPLTSSAPPPPPVSTNSDDVVTSQSVDPEGSTVFVTTTPPVSASSASASASSSPTSAPSNGSGLSTGSIIGMSVAGGVAVIGIVAFFVWKFTRKRFGDFDDNEAIRWPDLNHHGGGAESYPLPTNNTGRSGFGTESETNLSRTPSDSTNYTGSRSTDPYAVPPLPHLNPNQPYLDDPGSAYYDPYHGPVPHSLDDPSVAHPAGGWPGESIAMTQIRSQSPGPGQALGGYNGGRASPAPGMRAPSPGPAQAYNMYEGGRASPGPQMMAGRRSPGPNVGLR